MRQPTSRDDNLRFPWIGATVPLVASCILSVVTGSPVALLFGLLSPVMFVAQYLETRRTARRRAERESRERDDEREQANIVQRESEAREVARASALHPPADRLAQLVPDARRRAPDAREMPQVRLGITLDAHPVVVGLTEGIVVDGKPSVIRDVRRALTAQTWWAQRDVRNDARMVATPGHERWLIRATNDVFQLIDREAPGVEPVTFRPDRLSARSLAELRDVMLTMQSMRVHQNQGVTAGGVSESNSARHLATTVGTTEDGQQFEVDLIVNGPHVVVSGMTGSGKTTFVIGWLLGLAERYGPDALEISVIDFKGGLDFGPIVQLPHCVGLASDNDSGSIDRALAGLAAEILRRESVMKGMNNLDALPRLIVVLDEFRATAVAHPHAVGMVVDLAARGRALGIHVMLCTQRASTSVTEDIMANVPVRIAFRALSAAESRFMLGDERASAQLRHSGEALIAGVGPDLIFVRSTQELIGGIERSGLPAESRSTERASEGYRNPARQLWMPALPRRLTVDEARHHVSDDTSELVARSSLCLGLADVPAHQRWETVWFAPEVEGSFLVSGPTRSGRSSALKLLASQERSNTDWLTSGIDLWDALDERCAPAAPAGSVRHVIVDGLERILGSLGIEFRDVLSERLSLALREDNGRRFWVSSDAEGAWVLRFASLFPHRIELSGDVAGRARWRGATIQLAVPPSTVEHEETRANSTIDSDASFEPECIVVTNNRANSATLATRRLMSLGRVVTHIATPEEWMGRITDFSALARDHAVVVTADVTPAESRMLLRSVAPVPPVASGGAIVFLPDGRYQRMRIEPDGGNSTDSA